MRFLQHESTVSRQRSQRRPAQGKVGDRAEPGDGSMGRWAGKEPAQPRQWRATGAQTRNWRSSPTNMRKY